MFVNPSYNPSTLSNSIAILRLSSSVQLGQLPTITTGCLSSTQITGLRCWVSGWGATAFQSGVTGNSIQTQVDVPLVDQTTCQNTLRTTKLGSNFILDTNSFMCAGGETGKGAKALSNWKRSNWNKFIPQMRAREMVEARLSAQLLVDGTSSVSLLGASVSFELCLTPAEKWLNFVFPGCGTTNVPGVYINVTNYISWIQSTTNTY